MLAVWCHLHTGFFVQTGRSVRSLASLIHRLLLDKSDETCFSSKIKDPLIFIYNFMTVNNHTSNPPPQNDPIALLLPVLLHVRWLKLPSPSLPEAPSAPSAFVHMALLLCVWSAGRHLSVVRPAGGAGTVVGKW